MFFVHKGRMTLSSYVKDNSISLYLTHTTEGREVSTETRSDREVFFWFSEDSETTELEGSQGSVSRRRSSSVGRTRTKVKTYILIGDVKCSSRKMEILGVDNLGHLSPKNRRDSSTRVDGSLNVTSKSTVKRRKYLWYHRRPWRQRMTHSPR